DELPDGAAGAPIHEGPTASRAFLPPKSTSCASSSFQFGQKCFKRWAVPPRPAADGARTAAPPTHEVEFDGSSDGHSTGSPRAMAARRDGEGDAVRGAATARRAQCLRARSTARTPCPSRDGQAVYRG